MAEFDEADLVDAGYLVYQATPDVCDDDLECHPLENGGGDYPPAVEDYSDNWACSGHGIFT